MQLPLVSEQHNEIVHSGRVKCVVWDLDNTLWKGILLEDELVVPDDYVVATIRALDERGILQSVASRNDRQLAMAKLAEFGLQEYFLYPQINWNSKASSIEAVAKSLNIGAAQICFVDDQEFELEEVRFSLPDVLCITADTLPSLMRRPEMSMNAISDEARERRHLYMEDIERSRSEEEFRGTKAEFLATLQMKFQIARVREGDLKRAEELTLRTSQLNSTGYTYSYEELESLRVSPDHKLLIAELTDRFGNYGKIGLGLIETSSRIWTIKLLLMSCRVMSRSVGTIMLISILRMARDHDAGVRAEFIPTSRNRMMLITFRLAGFKEISRSGDSVVLEHDLKTIPAIPEFVTTGVLL